jgi:hypothetical protein
MRGPTRWNLHSTVLQGFALGLLGLVDMHMYGLVAAEDGEAPSAHMWATNEQLKRGSAWGLRGLRAAPTRENPSFSELAGRVTRHCRALAMHGMHVLAANAPSLRVPRCCGHSSTRFPGLWYPVTVALIYVSNDSSKSSSPPVANQGHKMPPRLRPSHHLLPPPGSWCS